MILMAASIGVPIVLSYALGSVPFGLWLGLWWRQVDIRCHGSKNIGATNTMRVLGKKLGAAALAGDMAKGFLPVLLAGLLPTWPLLPLACGLSAILGHTFSLFLNFKGGKGVATSAGAFLGLAPLPTLIGAAVFFAVVAMTRMVSAASISAALAIAATVFFFSTPTAVKAVAVLVAVLVIVKHRSNIGRILRGEESRI